MSKWYGVIGFREMKETVPGVWSSIITERNYYGEVTRNSRRYQTADKINDDVVVTNEISIIADPYANHNFHSICYVEFMGNKWSVPNVTVDIDRPRLILTLGGVYNGEQA